MWGGDAYPIATNTESLIKFKSQAGASSDEWPGQIDELLDRLTGKLVMSSEHASGYANEPIVFEYELDCKPAKPLF